MRTFRASVGLGALLLLAACGVAQEAAVAPPVALPKPTCTKTAATPAAQRPALLAGTTGSWYGSADLWVGLPDHPAVAHDGSMELRFPWVTLNGDKPSPDIGQPEVSAVRSGAPDAVAATFTGYSRAFGTGNLAFWPSTVEFPDAGCWTVTGRLKATTVQFVIDVKTP